MSEQPARRFYAEAAVVRADRGFRIELDGRAVKTPAGACLEAPVDGLAMAIAAEWQAQDETIDPHTMPMMQLTCTALDRVAPHRRTVIAETVAYGGSDLLCYRSDGPDDLVRLQAENWQSVLDWLAASKEARLAVTSGVVHLQQPEDAMAALTRAVEALDDFPLTPLVRMTRVFGSLALALAVVDGRLAWQEGMRLALLDETYQSEKWGEDREALERRRSMTEDVAQAARFFDLVTA